MRPQLTGPSPRSLCPPWIPSGGAADARTRLCQCHSISMLLHSLAAAPALKCRGTSTHPKGLALAPSRGRSTWLLKTIAGAGRPCLFVGDSGTAKSVTIAAFLAGLGQGATTSRVLGFSSRTSSMDVQRSIEDCVEKRTKVGYDLMNLAQQPSVQACPHAFRLLSRRAGPPTLFPLHTSFAGHLRAPHGQAAGAVHR